MKILDHILATHWPTSLVALVPIRGNFILVLLARWSIIVFSANDPYQ